MLTRRQLLANTATLVTLSPLSHHGGLLETRRTKNFPLARVTGRLEKAAILKYVTLQKRSGLMVLW